MNQKGFSVIFLLVIIVIAALGVFGFYFIRNKNYFKTVSTDKLDETLAKDCIQGKDGNTGDNYCSNLHEPSSVCRPNTENTYSDGCTGYKPVPLQ